MCQEEGKAREWELAMSKSTRKDDANCQEHIFSTKWGEGEEGWQQDSKWNKREDASSEAVKEDCDWGMREGFEK